MGMGEGKYSVVGGKQYKIQHFEPGSSDDPSPVAEFTGGHGHFLIRKDGSIRQWGYWSRGGYEIAKTLSAKLLGFVDYTAPKPKRTPKRADVEVVESLIRFLILQLMIHQLSLVVKPDIPVNNSSPKICG